MLLTQTLNVLSGLNTQPQQKMCQKRGEYGKIVPLKLACLTNNNTKQVQEQLGRENRKLTNRIDWTAKVRPGEHRINKGAE